MHQRSPLNYYQLLIHAYISGCLATGEEVGSNIYNSFGTDYCVTSVLLSQISRWRHMLCFRAMLLDEMLGLEYKACIGQWESVPSVYVCENEWKQKGDVCVASRSCAWGHVFQSIDYFISCSVCLVGLLTSCLCFSCLHSLTVCLPVCVQDYLPAPPQCVTPGSSCSLLLPVFIYPQIFPCVPCQIFVFPCVSLFSLFFLMSL